MIAIFKKKKYRCKVAVKAKASSQSATSSPEYNPSASTNPSSSASPDSSDNPTQSPDNPADDDTTDITSAGSKTLTLGSMKVVMGESIQDTISLMGSATRKGAKSAFGTDIYVFKKGSGYNNIIYVLVKNDVVVGAYTISSKANYANIAKSGMTEQTLLSNGFSQETRSGNSSIYVNEEDGYSVEAYVDLNGTEKTYAIRIYSNSYEYDDMMRSDYNEDNYKQFEKASYNGSSLYVSDEYDKEFAELMCAYRAAVGISNYTVYTGCGREMAEIGASRGYGSATDYTDDEKTIMKKSVQSAGSGQISTGLKSVFAGDTYADPFTAVTNFAELDATYSTMVDTTRTCIMAGYAYNPTYSYSYLYAVVWGAKKGALA